MDKLRLTQVIDNIVNNSFKYAKTRVDVSFAEKENGVTIEIRDTGTGVSQEELVLITEKYFRGSNAKGATGSGLGLYLAKSFMEQMRGSMECHNDGGFVVTLFLQKV
jgi:signal transduction histidine kinase